MPDKPKCKISLVGGYFLCCAALVAQTTGRPNAGQPLLVSPSASATVTVRDLPVYVPGVYGTHQTDEDVDPGKLQSERRQSLLRKDSGRVNSLGYSASIGGTGGGPEPSLYKSFGSVVPCWITPDTQGAVGPLHLMTALNGVIQIQDRSGTVISHVGMYNFWLPVSSSAGYDPRIAYDPLSNRWILITLDNNLLIGASQTSDPTGRWNLQKTAANTNEWLDFPTLGITKDWIAVVVNAWRTSPKQYIETRLYLYNKSDLLRAGTAVAHVFTIRGYGIPASSYDPAQATLYLVGLWGGYYHFDTITGSVGSEIYTPDSPAAITFGSPVGATPDKMPQYGTAEVVTNRSGIGTCVFRNGSLWCAEMVGLPPSAPTRSSIQWWQANPQTGVVAQGGRVDDPVGNTSYLFPSIAVNKNKDVLIGYSSFSATQYPSANFAFRDHGDPAGELRSDTIYKRGVSAITCCNGPYYGDYSASVVDPSDDLTLWTLQEYAETPLTGQSQSGTWWAAVRPSPSCAYVLDTISVNLPASGAIGQISVTTTADCSWAVGGVPAWMSITTGAAGTGTGVITYSVSNNASGAVRTARLTIASGVAVDISQPALPELTVSKSHSGVFRQGQFGAT